MKSAQSTDESLEIEVKLPLRDLMPLNSAGLGVYEVTPRHFEDNWLMDTPDHQLQQRGSALRVRFANGRGVITYKGPAQADSTFKVREEIESDVSDPHKCVEIFERLGYRNSFRYQKYRTVLCLDLPSGRSLMAMFDETPLGNFLELEGGREEIIEVAKRIGFSPSQFITAGYPTLQAQACAAAGKPFENLIFTTGEGSA